MFVETQDLAISFTTLGGLMILGLAAQWLGQKSSIPRVSLLIGLGMLMRVTWFL